MSIWKQTMTRISWSLWHEGYEWYETFEGQQRALALPALRSGTTSTLTHKPVQCGRLSARLRLGIDNTEQACDELADYRQVGRCAPLRPAAVID